MFNLQEAITLVELLNIGSKGVEDSCQIRRNLRKISPEWECTEGASKNCLYHPKKSYVIKWVFPNRRHYSEAVDEVNIYKQAVAEGIEVFFPKTEYLFTHNGIDFVIQEKVDSSANELYRNQARKQHLEKIAKTPSDKLVHRMEQVMHRQADRGCNRNLNPLWAKVAVSLYGKYLCKKLCYFISEHGINDLHSANIGFNGIRPVILDFSGYHR